MTVKITIIGTGQIGASIGLALGTHKDLFVRVGHDKDLQAANRAKAMGAVDKVDYNLPSSVSGAEIVVLALPLDQIRETMQYVASELKEDAILMDTAPLKGPVIGWAKELLPPGRYYIGLTPAINPEYLKSPGFGIESARVDLFKDGLMAIYLPPDLPDEAIKLASDFSSLLGAGHLFIDPVELDSLMAATHILPQLVAAALVNTTVDVPGWQDGRKLAGRPYAFLTGAMGSAGEVESLAVGSLSSRENLLRRVDLLMGNLEQLRKQLDSADEDNLKQDLERARLAHDKWVKERIAANWSAQERGPGVELPTTREVLTRMFTFGGWRKPKQPK